MARFPHSHVRFIIFSGKRNFFARSIFWLEAKKIFQEEESLLTPVASRTINRSDALSLIQLKVTFRRAHLRHTHVSGRAWTNERSAPAQTQTHKMSWKSPIYRFWSVTRVVQGKHITPLFKEWFLSRDSVKNADEWGV